MTIDPWTPPTVSEKIHTQKLLAALTPRELQILKFTTHGFSNKETAHELGLVEKTVKAYRSVVMGKMEAKSFAQLVRAVERIGV